MNDIYQTKKLVDAEFDFAKVFPVKQKYVQDTENFEFRLTEVVSFLHQQTDNFKIENPVALDVDRAIVHVVTRWAEQEGVPNPFTPDVELVEEMPIEAPIEVFAEVSGEIPEAQQTWIQGIETLNELITEEDAEETYGAETIENWKEAVETYTELLEDMGIKEVDGVFKMTMADGGSAYQGGGEVTTLGKGDSVVYKDETWYITEKEGKVGIVSMRQGAWGSDNPFVPLTEISQDEELTDMYGNKVFIPYTFETYQDGGEIKKLEKSLSNAEKNYQKAIQSERVGVISSAELKKAKNRVENARKKVNDWYATRPIKKSDGGTLQLKGNEADKVFHLPYESAIYVPSTQDVDNVISIDEMESRTDEVKEYLAKLFGGYTSSETVGGFVDSSGQLVNEEVVKVTSFSSREDFEKNKPKLLKQLAKWGKDWGQEAIGYEFEGDLYYIPQSFAEGGEVAQIIYRQLGGSRFAMMTGARNFVQSSKDKWLSFRIGRNKSKANFVKIQLNSMDTYDMTFGRIHGYEYRDLKTFNGLYGDQLEEIFQDYTGLYTRLKEGGETDHERYIVYGRKSDVGEPTIFGYKKTSRAANMFINKLEKEGKLNDYNSWGFQDTQDYFYSGVMKDGGETDDDTFLSFHTNITECEKELVQLRKDGIKCEKRTLGHGHHEIHRII